jgi:hypothetical protein
MWYLFTAVCGIIVGYFMGFFCFASAYKKTREYNFELIKENINLKSQIAIYENTVQRCLNKRRKL